MSYSSFAYSGLSAKRTPKGAEIRAMVKNTSKREGDEVVQLYVAGGPEPEAPIRSLRGFQRIRLRAGESRQLSFTVAAEDLPKNSGVEISVGGGQPLPNVQFVKLENSGHQAQNDESDRFNDLVLRFFAQKVAATAAA